MAGTTTGGIPANPSSIGGSGGVAVAAASSGGSGVGTAGIAAVGANTAGGTVGTNTAGIGAVGANTAGVGAAGGGTPSVDAGGAGTGATDGGTADGGNAGASGRAGDAGAAGATGFRPRCLSKGAELALIGDDWINYRLGEQLAPRLASRAVRDGALPQGSAFNDQAQSGFSLASGGLGLLADEWAPAKTAAQTAATSVKFVVMDGGGNDIVLGQPSCLQNGTMREQDSVCQKAVKDATLAAMMLQQKMKTDGVGQALYFFYPHMPTGGWDVLDYFLPMARTTCTAMNDDKYQCYFVDTREAFQGPGNTGVAMASLIGSDGIHPTAAGDDILADLIWKTMKDHCMAQAAGSGCCVP
jgi:lysophospholipase L1-like esterase